MPLLQVCPANVATQVAVVASALGYSSMVRGWRGTRGWGGLGSPTRAWVRTGLGATASVAHVGLHR